MTLVLIVKYVFLLLMLCVPAAVLLLPLYWRHQQRSRILEVLRLTSERGEPVPHELLQALPDRSALPSAARDFRRGVMLIATGVAFGLLGFALTIVGHAFLGEQGVAFGVIAGALGVIPLCIGVALMLLSRFSRTPGKM